MFTIPTAKFSKSRQRKVPDYLANLTGWWKLDDGSGTTAADSIGTTDATTETGTLAWASDGVGEFTSCAEFNGSTNMQINKKAMSENGGSISLWVKTNTGGMLTPLETTYYRWPSGGAANPYSLASFGYLEIWDEHSYFNYYANDNNADSTRDDAFSGYGPAVKDNQWHHFVIVSYGKTDNGRIDYYQDGVFIGTDPSSAGKDWDTYENFTFKIGRGQFYPPDGGTVATRWYTGRLSDLRTYSEILDADKVTRIYANG